jgi:putative acetyltransferase
MPYKIKLLQKDSFPAVLKLWEASVNITHHFLSKADIVEVVKPSVEINLPHLKLEGIFDQKDTMLGFAGTDEEKLELLFIDPERMKEGLGKLLLNHVVNNGVTYVDVVKDNQPAIAFYLNQGFSILESKDELIRLKVSTT